MSEEDIPEKITKPLIKLSESINSMKSHVDKLILFYREHANKVRSSLDNAQEDNDESLSPLSMAKLDIALVYSLNACYWLSLVTHGQDPRATDVTKTIERIKMFMNRSKDVEESIRSRNNSSAKRPMIDKEASKRLCLNNMTVSKAG